jgi:hypothetical protein
MFYNVVMRGINVIRCKAICCSVLLYDVNRCEIGAQTLRNRCEIAAESIRNRRGIVARSIRDRFSIAAHSIRNHEEPLRKIETRSPQIRNNRTIAALPLCIRCAIAVKPLRDHLEIKRNQFAIATKLPRKRFVISVVPLAQSIRNRCKIALEIAVQRCAFTRNRLTIAEKSLRNRCESLRNPVEYIANQ